MPATITLDHWKSADKRVFEHKKSRIQDALSGSTGIINGITEENKEEIFYMLLFCLCVPQSKAVKAEEAIEILRSKDYYNNELSESEVCTILKGRVRFQFTKSKRLVSARHQFLTSSFWKALKSYYRDYVPTAIENRFTVLHSARRYLIQAVNGIGMKLASHFLRNIGMSGLCILDVHVIDGLHKRGVVESDKLGPSKAEYMKIEEKMKEYANSVELSVDELDLLLWSQKTGYVFK